MNEDIFVRFLETHALLEWHYKALQREYRQLKIILADVQ